MTDQQLRPPSARAQHAAELQGYGPWVRTVEVNRRSDRRMRVNMLVLVLFAPWPFLWMAYEAAPWQPDGGSAAGFVASGLAGLVFLVIAVFFVFGLVQSFRVGGAQAHLFEDAIVLERPRGNLAAFPYSKAHARYVVWQQPWEGQYRDRVQLWIEVEGYGSTICLDGFSSADAQALPTIARAFGLPDTPEPIGTIEGSGPTPF